MENFMYSLVIRVGNVISKIVEIAHPLPETKVMEIDLIEVEYCEETVFFNYGKTVDFKPKQTFFPKESG